MSPDLDFKHWRKSSYSNTNGGDCVEINLGDEVGEVRDSKAKDAGHLRFSAGAFASFVKAARECRFDG
ncbi:DUF397 domain-containing protein [Saccharothrix lopnurensis]|uniref:DUF397 domain-containing protein n=1 Tax=Saccharothrix lopnurensis TaxID=1670621 RepID=A0ABW1P8B7_9PSEU